MKIENILLDYKYTSTKKRLLIVSSIIMVFSTYLFFEKYSALQDELANQKIATDQANTKLKKALHKKKVYQKSKNNYLI